jgi:hypothetical protein
MSAGRNTFIALAGAPNAAVPDADQHLFTGSFLAALKTPGLDLGEVFGRIYSGVDSASRHNQEPWSVSNVAGIYVFRPGPEPSPGTPPVEPPVREPRPVPAGPVSKTTSPTTTSPAVQALVGEWKGDYSCTGGGGSLTYHISESDGEIKVKEHFVHKVFGPVGVPGDVVYTGKLDEPHRQLHLRTQGTLGLEGYEVVLSPSRDGRSMKGVYVDHPNGCTNVSVERLAP